MKPEEIRALFTDPRFVEVYLETEATTLSYSKHYRTLVNLLELREGNRLLDVGAHHGTSMLELFRREPSVTVVPADPSAPLLEILRAKFYGTNLAAVLSQFLTNGAVFHYLANQHEECRNYASHVLSPTLCFAEELEQAELADFDHILGSMALHWLYDPQKAFINFNHVLKKGGTIATTCSSWKFTMKNKEVRPIEQSPLFRSFYQNLDQLFGSKAVSENEEKWDFSTLTALLAQTGFDLVSYREEAIPLTFGHVLMSLKAGSYYTRAGRLPDLPSDGLVSLIKSALHKTLQENNVVDILAAYPSVNCYLVARKVKEY